MSKESIDNLLRDLANAPTHEEGFLDYALGKLFAYFPERKPAGPRFFRARGGGAIEDWRQAPAARRKMLAAAIDREIAMLADELRHRGVRNPITGAREALAKRYRHASGAALKRWLCRNR
jgi:hypothetical protein